MRPFIIGTAGHIDHGKSAVVKALTGINPDRFQEELDRGMTIDLGFAFLTDEIAIIDVPGHERFIKNMVAGVATVDALMLVVAADDSVMPQTREHLYIAELLGIRRGFVVLNKTDTITDDWLLLVEEEIREVLRGTFLENTPIVRCSAKTGDGITHVRDTILALEKTFKPRQDTGVFRLPVDRVFTLKGIGTVVTGSVISGSVSEGDTVTIYPTLTEAKIRSIQTQGRQVPIVSTGERASLNLHRISKHAITRGNEISLPDSLYVSKRFAVQVSVLPSSPVRLKYGHRIRVHAGTGEYIGRIYIVEQSSLAQGETGYGQIVLENPVAFGFQDRYIIRHYSPPHIIGGGSILGLPDTPVRKKNRELLPFLRNLAREFDSRSIDSYLKFRNRLVSLAEICRHFTRPDKEIRDLIRKNQNIHEISLRTTTWLIDKKTFQKLKQTVIDTISQFHDANPKLRGIDEITLKNRSGLDGITWENVMENLLSEDAVRQDSEYFFLPRFSVQFTARESIHLDQLRKLIPTGSFSTETLPRIKEKIRSQPGLENWMLETLISTKEWVLLPNDVIVPKAVLDRAEKVITAYLKTHHEATVSELKTVLDTTRKHLIPVLNYFDSKGVTIRHGDVRIPAG